jgi:hypothetical protein
VSFDQLVDNNGISLKIWGRGVCIDSDTKSESSMWVEPIRLFTSSISCPVSSSDPPRDRDPGWSL